MMTDSTESRARPTGSTRRIQVAFAIVVLSLLAFGMRTWRLESKSIGYEEGQTLLRVWSGTRMTLASGSSSPQLVSADWQPPLYYLSLSAFARLAGEGDLGLRFLSVAWAALLVPLLYVTGTRLWSRQAGVVAALLGAASPLYLWYAQQAQPYAMLAALGLFAVYALDRGLEEQRTAWLVAAGLSAVAAVSAHHAALVLLPVLGLQALWAGRTAPVWRRAIAVASLVLAAAGLFAVGYAAAPRGNMAQPAPGPAGLLAALRGLPTIAAGPSAPWLAVWLAGLVLLGLCLLGALGPTSDRRRMLLGSYLLLPVLTVGVTALARPALTGAGYLMLASPALYLGAARGLERGRRLLRPLAVLAGLVVLGGMGAGVAGLLALPHQGTGPDYRLAARMVQRYERSGDVIVLSAPQSATAFRHYYKGRLPAIILPPPALDASPDRDAINQATASVAARFGRVWLVTGPGNLSDPQGYVEDWLRNAAFLADALPGGTGGAGAILQLYLGKSPVLQEVPSPQHTQQVSFGSLELEGYDLPMRPVAGGERAWVTLYWRPLYPRDVSISLKLLDEQGRQWARAEELSYPTLPAWQWPVGSVVRQEASIAVPPGVPRGWYRLELRLYDPQSRRPIEPLPGAQPGPLPLGPLRVDSTWARRSPPGSLPAAAHTLLGGGMRFGDTVALRAYGLATPTVRPGQWLHLDLYWQVEQPPDRDLSLTLALIDAGGEAIASWSGPPVTAQHPPVAWQAGELLWAQHELLVPAIAQPGVLRLRMDLSDASGRKLPIRNQWRFWTWGEDTAFLDAVRVAQAPSGLSWPRMEQAVGARNTAGLELLGFDGALRRLSPGDTWDLTLYWRAAEVPATSYKVSVQLLAADERTILAQEDSIPANWTRPTTGWEAGEIVADRHELVVPAEIRPQSTVLIVALYDEDTNARVQWLLEDQLRMYVVLCQADVER